MEHVDAWARSIRAFVENGLTVSRVSGETGAFTRIESEEIAQVVTEDRVIRLLGADRPIDIFRSPRNLDISDFDRAWERGIWVAEKLKMLDAIDLVVTKMDTGRGHDEADIRFLETKIEADYRAQLDIYSLEDVRLFFQRFVTPEIAAFTAKNACDAGIRAFAEDTLNDMRSAGDPYAEELARELRNRGDERGMSRWSRAAESLCRVIRRLRSGRRGTQVTPFFERRGDGRISSA